VTPVILYFCVWIRVGPVILKLRELIPFFIFILWNDLKKNFIKNVAKKKKKFLSKSFIAFVKSVFCYHF
jgi:hypothetical protein